MKRYGPRAVLLGALFGALIGILLSGALSVWVVFGLADWLVVKSKIRPADVAVVLGGGGGSRLRKGIELYGRKMVAALVLLGPNEREWRNRLDRLCTECKTGGKPLIMLSGSKNTMTDAELVYTHCVEKGIRRILVVTDPYHTRRASLVFNRKFADSGIEVTTVSPGEFGDRLPPTEKWWRDEPTLRVVVTETAKIVGYLLAFG